MIHRIASAAVALLALSGAARADNPDHEAIWKRYWLAIYTYQRCNEVDFSQAQYDAMVHVINQKVQHDLGAGVRTMLMSDAKSEARDLTFRYGCNSPEAAVPLTFYKSDLAPVVH